MPDSLRQAVRALVRQPRLSLLAIALLGLGLGLATGVYSLARGLILRGLPFPYSDRLVAVGEVDPRSPDDGLPVRLSSLQAWGARQRSLERLVAFSAAFAVVRWPGGETDAYVGASVEPELFPLLGVRAQLGRLPLRSDCATGGGVVVVSDAIWRRQFGGRASILGAAVAVNQVPRTVIGVVPKGFGFPFRQELWTPLCPQDLQGVDEESFALFTVGRLRPGVSLGPTRAEFRALAASTAPSSASSPEGGSSPAPTAPTPRLSARVDPYLEAVTDPNLRRALAAVGGGAGLLLLVCCGTVALLLLLAAMRAEGALALRVALGASAGRLQRETWLAALLLSLAGAVVGIGVAQLCLVVFDRLLAPTSYLRGFWVGVHLDGMTLAFALGTAILAVPLAALLPALRTARADPMSALRRAAGGTLGGVGWPGRLLIGGQVALSCVLLVGAAVTASAGLRSLRAPYGFDPAGLTIAKVTLFGKASFAQTTPEEAGRIWRRALARLRAMPEVRGAALTSALPTMIQSRQEIVLHEGAPGGPRRSVRALAITPGYPATLGLPLLAGRDFAESDSAKSPPVLLVNRAFTRRHFGSDLGLGREVGLVREGEPAPAWYRVVGVVGDSALGDEEETWGETDPEALYFNLYQRESLRGFSGSLLVRSPVSAQRLAAPLRREAHAVEPGLAVWETESLEEMLRRGSWVSRAFAGLFGLFGLAAAAMSCAGLYGILALDVRRRRRDFGIHLALGAQRGDIVKRAVRRGAPELLGGLAAGLAVALFLARRFAGVFDGGPGQPFWIAGSVGLLALAGALALLLPLRRVSRSDPVAAMRPDSTRDR